MALYGEPKARPTPPPLDFDERTLSFADGGFHIMGVVNVTPDSFSDGGEHFARDSAIDHGVELAREGADIVDVGGESTRPGADPVAVEEELDRVLPVVDALADRVDALVSVDTTKAEVARRAVEAGADLVNDISGMRFDDDMPEVVADCGVPCILMHIQGTPTDMQNDIDYDDVVADIRAYFERRIERAVSAGIDPDAIVLDPGIGFGKTVEQNYRLVRELHAFFELDSPLLLGTSRKSFLGAVLDRPPRDRVWGTAATVACGLFAGADIVRVHDVAEMYDVVRITEAIAETDRRDD